MILMDPWPAVGNLEGTGSTGVISVLMTLRYAAADPDLAIPSKLVGAMDMDGSATDGFRKDGVTAWDAYLLWYRATGAE